MTGTSRWVQLSSAQDAKLSGEQLQRVRYLFVFNNPIVDKQYQVPSALLYHSMANADRFKPNWRDCTRRAH
jgi:hypothetical protein